MLAKQSTSIKAKVLILGNTIISFDICIHVQRLLSNGIPLRFYEHQDKKCH